MKRTLTLAQYRALRPRFFVLAAATLLFCSSIGAQPDGPIGKVRQPLVGGAVVSAEQQEEFGLLDLSGSCSASLLRNEWAITAAHCVEASDANGNPMPDPDLPGQNLLNPIGDITLTARWNTTQERTATRVITFRPHDIAIIRVASPFKVGGKTTGYSRAVYGPKMTPFFGSLTPRDIMVFGRGIHQFASGAGATAVPAQRDGQFRVGFFTTSTQDTTTYQFPSQNGQMIAGGDSGGPSFIGVQGGWALMGVHSSAQTQCLAGMPCGSWAGPGPVPANYNPWTWVAATPTSSDAPVAAVWDEIDRYLGALINPNPVGTDPAPGTGAVPPTGNVGRFGTLPPNFTPTMTFYGLHNNGDLMWYELADGKVRGPKKVGHRWESLLTIIAAGGNRLYGLMPDGTLRWYEHSGWDTGTFNWKETADVAKWDTNTPIFSGGEGVVYAIRPNGELVWRRNLQANGGGEAWTPDKVIGSAWNQFRQVFSTGGGKIYALRPNGELLFYQHTDYLTGGPTWQKERLIANNWHHFRRIAPGPNGVILAIQGDGKLLWYKHGQKRGLFSFGGKESWEGPLEIGSGWQDIRQLIVLLPGTPDVVR